jgi:HlyD family secretion protein
VPKVRNSSEGVLVKKLLVFLLTVGAALVGIAIWAHYPRAHVLSESRLQFTQLQVGDLRESVSATGRIEPREVLAVTPQVPGTVVALYGKINDVIDENSLLAQLDDHQLKLDVEHARSGVDAAQAALIQAEAMKKAAQFALQYQLEIEKKGGFRSDRDQAEAKLEAAQAGVFVAKSQLHASETSLKKAKESFDKTRIKAPGNCQAATATAALGLPVPPCKRFLILERHVQLGQVVGPQGPPLFLVTRDLDVVEVHAQVAEGDIGKVRPGLRASFTVQAYTDEDVLFTGTVREIRPMAINAKGAVYFDAVIDVANTRDPQSGEWRLRPGMTASVDIIRREHKNVWRLPASALNFQLDEGYWSAAARVHIQEWRQQHADPDWQPIWTWDSAKGSAWPIFVRLGGADKNGEPGLKEGEFNEILEWEPGHRPNPAEPIRIIISAPPARPPGIFEQPWNIKVS